MPQAKRISPDADPSAAGISQIESVSIGVARVREVRSVRPNSVDASYGIPTVRSSGSRSAARRRPWTSRRPACTRPRATGRADHQVHVGAGGRFVGAQAPDIVGSRPGPQPRGAPWRAADHSRWRSPPAWRPVAPPRVGLRVSDVVPRLLPAGAAVCAASGRPRPATSAAASTAVSTRIVRPREKKDDGEGPDWGDGARTTEPGRGAPDTSGSEAVRTLRVSAVGSRLNRARGAQMGRRAPLPGGRPGARTGLHVAGPHGAHYFGPAAR